MDISNAKIFQQGNKNDKNLHTQKKRYHKMGISFVKETFIQEEL